MMNRFPYAQPSPEEKGLRGEWAIDDGIFAAQKMGFPGRIVHNIYVPNKHGTHAEIDVLYITQKGIFVFESKNYRGWIFGDGKSTYWTLCVSPNTKHKFYNPILQNQGHIRVLSEYIQQKLPFFSVIAYSAQCEIKKMSQVPANTYMVHYYDVPSVIQQVWSTQPDIISNQQVAELFQLLVTLRSKDLDIINNHIQSVQNIVNNQHICPKCGKELVLRTAKKGTNAGQQFWGCSNYPKCTYTRAL